MAALEEHGILLLTDARLPSLASLVAGGPVRGSWWGHPKGHSIFATAEALADNPGVTTAKLVSGKVTFFHRRLWPALLSVGMAREEWQTRGLTRAARALLERVGREGRLRADQIRGGGRKDVARELEARLLLRTEGVHTERGAHQRVLESWGHWAKRAGFSGKPPAPARARKDLEGVVFALNARFGGEGRLPWS